jgi:hypothetical protein
LGVENNKLDDEDAINDEWEPQLHVHNQVDQYFSHHARRPVLCACFFTPKDDEYYYGKISTWPYDKLFQPLANTFQHLRLDGFNNKMATLTREKDYVIFNDMINGRYLEKVLMDCPKLKSPTLNSSYLISYHHQEAEIKIMRRSLERLNFSNVKIHPKAFNYISSSLPSLKDLSLSQVKYMDPYNMNRENSFEIDLPCTDLDTLFYYNSEILARTIAEFYIIVEQQDKKTLYLEGNFRERRNN